MLEEMGYLHFYLESLLQPFFPDLQNVIIRQPMHNYLAVFANYSNPSLL